MDDYFSPHYHHLLSWGRILWPPGLDGVGEEGVEVVPHHRLQRAWGAQVVVVGVGEEVFLRHKKEKLVLSKGCVDYCIVFT